MNAIVTGLAVGAIAGLASMIPRVLGPTAIAVWRHFRS